jgi:hypothetical protein
MKKQPIYDPEDSKLFFMISLVSYDEDLFRAVILFRNVEHCGISSALGINSRNSVQELDAIARV